VKFFFDNCMSPHHATGVSAFCHFPKHEIVHLETKFGSPDVKDVTWIKALGEERDWIVISGDLRITRSAVEKQAWIESGLTGFFFADAWSTSSYWNKAADLIRWWQDITRLAKQHPRSYGFVIPKEGKRLKQLFPIRE
jgi:hypothetical protein